MRWNRTEHTCLPIHNTFSKSKTCSKGRLATEFFSRLHCPSLSFPCGPTLTHASNHPALRRVRNQIGMTQGCHEGLYRTYKALIPSCLLLRHRKPTLTKLEV